LKFGYYACFARLYQAEMSFFYHQGKSEGTGMGLAVVHGIVTDHGGDIFVRSEPDRGATFTVFLPAVERRIKLENREDAALPTGTERILFIDDEAALSADHQSRRRLGGDHIDGEQGRIDSLLKISFWLLKIIFNVNII